MGDFNAYKIEDYTITNLNILKDIKKNTNKNLFDTVKYLENLGYIDGYQWRSNILNIPLSNIVPVNTTDKGGRIDYIFLHRDITLNIMDIFTYYTNASDHLPIILDLQIN